LVINGLIFITNTNSSSYRLNYCSLRGCITIDSLVRVFEMCAAILTASGLSPCTQILSARMSIFSPLIEVKEFSWIICRHLSEMSCGSCRVALGFFLDTRVPSEL